jgi:hypothetical protein
VSKFVGKFRKNSNYSDDYNALKQSKDKIGRKNEHKEVKKMIYRRLNDETLDIPILEGEEMWSQEAIDSESLPT